GFLRLDMAFREQPVLAVTRPDHQKHRRFAFVSHDDTTGLVNSVTHVDPPRIKNNAFPITRQLADVTKRLTVSGGDPKSSSVLLWYWLGDRPLCTTVYAGRAAERAAAARFRLGRPACRAESCASRDVDPGGRAGPGDPSREAWDRAAEPRAELV